jgi:hypothetical protein
MILIGGRGWFTPTPPPRSCLGPCDEGCSVGLPGTDLISHHTAAAAVAPGGVSPCRLQPQRPYARLSGSSPSAPLLPHRVRPLARAVLSYFLQDPAWPGLPIGLASGFSWINAFGSALGAAFPIGMDYPTLHRITDVFNVHTEFVVINLAQSLGVLAALGVLAGWVGEGVLAAMGVLGTG